MLFAADPVLLEIARDPDWVPEATRSVRADEKGKVADSLLQSGWAYSAYESGTARTVLVEGRGFYSIFVNGERFGGDFYRHGLLRARSP